MFKLTFLLMVLGFIWFLLFIPNIQQKNIPEPKFAIRQKNSNVQLFGQISTENVKLINSTQTSQNASEIIDIVLYHDVTGWIDTKVLDNCQSKCRFVHNNNNKSKWKTSDYVVFLGPLLKNVEPPEKPKGQTWIYLTQESPHRNPDLHKWNFLFNWTMSYRRDADILYPYGSFKVRSPSLSSLRDSSVYFKTSSKGNQTRWKYKKTCAWVVSNCKTPSKRSQYVYLMKRRVPIDIFGACGSRKCPPYPDTSCINMISDNYKFYLSFENTLCRDYVTEKSFNIYSNAFSAIPIVRGGSGAHDIFLPPGSFIDTSYYKTISELTNYLRNVSEEKAYSYFNWRNFYERQDGNPCDLCDIVRKRRLDSFYKQRLYENIDNWMQGSSKDPTCVTPNDLKAKI